MSIITANLKHLYQCRTLWLWYFYIFAFGFSQISIYAHSDRNAGAGLGLLHFWLIFFNVYFSGMLIGSLVANVLSKPFTYTLPGHRHISRGFVVYTGMVAGLAPFLIVLWLEPSTGTQKWLAATAFYLLVLAICLMISRQSFRVSNPRFARTYGILLGFLGIVPIFLQIRYDFLRIWITDYPFITSGLSVIVILIFYRQLNGDKLARTICGKPMSGLAAGTWRITQKRQRALWQAKGDKSLTSSAVDVFFLDRMRQTAALSKSRFYWGMLYERLATFLHMSGPLLLLTAGLIVCYFPMRYVGTIFLIPLFLLVQFRIPIRSNLLLPGGRMERFGGAITLIVSMTGLIVLMYLSLIGLSHLLAMIMPEISLRNITLSYRTVNGSILYAALALLPICFAIQILFPRHALIWALAVVMPSIMIFYGAVVARPNGFDELPPITIIPILLILWASLFLLLRHICLRRSLVGQKASF